MESTCQLANRVQLAASQVLLITTQSLAAPSSPTGAWISCIGPFFVTYLLTGLSGMPAMYEVNAKKWGDNPAYKKYLADTPAIYPFLNIPVSAIYALPALVVAFGVAKALLKW